MDLLYGFCLALLVLILMIKDKTKRKKFLSEQHFCPKCGLQLEPTITVEHLKKVRYNGKTYYGDFTKEHITVKCLNCGYSKEYDDA